MNEDSDFVKSKRASIFVLTWMKNHFQFQKRLNEFLDRSRIPSSADRLTAAVALTLQRFLHTRGYENCVRSEFTINTTGRSLRPDISVWAGEKVRATLVAVVECKTNFGYNRTGWRKQYEERTQKFRALNSKCLSFLCVLTRKNWNWDSFDKSPHARKDWFCLSIEWPYKVKDPVSDYLFHPSEPMCVSIKEGLRHALAN